MNKPSVLLTDDGRLEGAWPYTRERFEDRLKDSCELKYINLKDRSLEDFDWAEINAVALFGGDITTDILDSAPELKVVGKITDWVVPNGYDEIVARGIPFVDATPAWGQSVAEVGFALILCALRRIPYWHKRLADNDFDWRHPIGQFCDNPDFVNGELGTKKVGVVGLGQIGGRIAKWCSVFGATVMGYDPFIEADRFIEVGAQKTDLPSLVKECDILAIGTPPTPSSHGIVNADLIDELRQGAIVMTVTRAKALDGDALRRRVLKNELIWAADVYDIEPLPEDDPIRGRENVVHIPHIAGRTRDANLHLADMIAEDFLRVFAGEPVKYPLTAKTAKVRREADLLE